jgi:hypothetical protein
LPEPETEVEVPFSTAVSWSSAAVSWASAWSTVSCAEVGSSVASSWPWLTCWPTVTFTCWSVPLVLKLTVTSVPASTLPLPETVDCTTPSSAATTSREVRLVLPGGPISVTARTMTATATSPSTYRYHGLAGLSRRLRTGSAPWWGLGEKREIHL